MSIRTIIEINHDYLPELRDEPEHFKKLVRLLSSGDWESLEHNAVPGIRFLAERHHSDRLTVEVR